MLMKIADNYLALIGRVPDDVKIVAVSKTKPVELIRAVYEIGHRDFGENRVQELVAKQQALPLDINWHLIGHLQTNKVKYIVPFVSMIHSVDSLKLLTEINREAARNNRVIDCLLQFHIASEETKFGFTYDEAADMLKSPETKNLKNIRIAGVMGMATFTNDRQLIRNEFRNLRLIFTSLKSAFFSNDPSFREISMGMSGDYEIAIDEGSTIIRIGSLIFGER